MEIRNTENDVQSLRELYVTLQKRCEQRNLQYNTNDTEHDRIIHLPCMNTLKVVVNNDGTENTMNENNNTVDDTNDDDNNNNTNTITVNEIRNILYTFQQRIIVLHPMISKFIQRIQYVDPITQITRYGPQTKHRIQMNIIYPYQQQLLPIYNQLFYPSLVLQQQQQPPNQQNLVENNNDDNKSKCNHDVDTSNNCYNQLIMAHIENLANKENIEQEQQLALEEEEIVAQQKRKEVADIELQQQKQLEEQQRLQEQQEEFRRQTEQLMVQRQLQLQELEQQRMAEQLWVECIPNRNTLIGVQEQLHIFVHSCKISETDSSSSYKTSIQALHTLYSQIVSHPDNEQYRRIRQNHPQFIQDIGQYNGGKEILICSGFRIGYIENQPCYICTEPNVETDLDGWSDWYDLLKGTLQLIEEEMKAK